MAIENVQKKLNEDLLTATKQKNATVVRVLRFCKSMLDAVAKEQKQAQLSDIDAVKVIGKKIKQSRDAAEAFIKGGRTDLAEAEEEEIKILSAYLPPQLSDSELDEIVIKIIAETNASSSKEFGKVMGAAMRQIGNQADGDAVKKSVERNLQGA